MYKYLDKIDSPEDLKSLTREELAILCGEIREYIIECCSVNPGHVGSSLGAVELIVALHYVYNTPEDKIVFDVGHQAYAHKILTGRREAFRKNRTKEGISGFPKMSESPYDAFGVGHSSTAISAALGIAQGMKMQNKKNKVVAVVGDGALTGGLSIEGLNNAGPSNADILIILNDNDQSIDGNLGGMHDYLMQLTTSGRYNSLKKKVWDRIGDSKLRDWLQKITKDTKSNLVRKSGGAFFEDLGFRYFGPVDGNDISQMVTALRRLRNLHGPRILHIHTLKGKGYKPAEDNPTIWHAPGKFNPATGERISSPYAADRYQDVFGEVLVDLATLDDKVIGITPAMATGCGMSAFAAKFPERFFDVGIEEEHAVTFSAGLAAAGMRPICNIYSSFSQRAYDQILHDVAIQKLPVVLCLDRAGLVGEDGATHNGCFDLSAYRSIPGAIISAPSDEIELKNLMYSSLKSPVGPYIIRYPRGCGEGRDWRGEPYTFLETGKGRKIREGSRLAILALGPMAWRAVEAADEAKSADWSGPAVYDLRFLKPLDEAILEEARSYEAILTVEEGSIKGGLYGEVAELLAREDLGGKLRGIGVPDKFFEQDRQSNQRSVCSLDKAGILRAIESILSEISG